MFCREGTNFGGQVFWFTARCIADGERRDPTLINDCYYVDETAVPVGRRTADNGWENRFEVHVVAGGGSARDVSDFDARRPQLLPVRRAFR